LTREQWAVACQIGDHASARDLAARRGAALIGTLECLGSLTRVGLCTPVRAVGRREPLPSVPVGGRSAGPSAEPPPAPRMPVRHPARDYSVHDYRTQADRPDGPAQAPPADVLRQVLNGLRKLS